MVLLNKHEKMYCKIANLMKLPPLSDMGISKRVVANFQCFLKKRHTFYKKSKYELLDKEFLKICTQQPHMTVW